MLAACIDGVTASLHAQLPELGRNVAIDGSDLPAFANGQRYVSKNGPERERYSDPDASWGHRSAVSTRKGGGFYGYKLDMTVCTATDLPVPWNVRTARDNESIHALPLIDKARQRGFAVETRGDQVALPDRRVPAQIQGRPAAPADPARDGPLVIALPSPRLRRARVWSPQDRRDLRRCVSGRVEQVRLHADLTILAKLSCALNGRAPYP